MNSAHSDSFVELPAGAERLASPPAFAHQAFALRQHLGMQFHTEIMLAKIQDGLKAPDRAYPVNVLLHRNSGLPVALVGSGGAVQFESPVRPRPHPQATATIALPVGGADCVTD